ncbi:hypothetical protein AJ79_07678 [Helicocarpus griseus UAMH5409]|uniref:Uncharacterized protein n=1 Tax=Helicocarpus griseus UAMH5409 TaxID=1447875 RepID=A0A2B7X0Y2_9EURO|nr:hypothetical protein AJ79_07678 [Helicocarpus griseus UAMH5409]
MRFENWDVLLFPLGSKVPVQEFRTQCFVTRDNESPYIHADSLAHPSSHPLQGNYAHGNFGYTPILTAFVPSMARNTPFRVSVHSWHKPTPTRMMENLMQPEDSVVFEIRIFIDGVFIAGSLTTQMTGWPQVIDVDKNGDQDRLHFPAFHEELLQQTHWEAGEEFGRIRVVIAEGFSRPNRSPPFERVRDLIFFSFQHAPLNVLEHSNLAWPNPGMWHQASRPSLKYSLGVDYNNIREDEDAHSHSPTRPETRSIGFSDGNRSLPYSAWPHRFYPTPQTSWPRSAFPEREPRWPLQPVVNDPFVDTYRESGINRRARSSLSDVPMPDYVGSSSNSSRAISSMTGISLGQHSKQPSVIAPIDDEQYNQLIEALSPKKLTSGTHPPANTPASVPPMASKPSAAAEARAASHSRHASRPGALKELPQPAIRNFSGSSVRSDSDDGLGIENAPLPIRLLSPSPRVKGKKEGTGSEADSPLRLSAKRNTSSGKAVRKSKSSITASAESKRKRSGTSVEHRTANDNEGGSPSPTKKMSRVEPQRDCSPAGPEEDLEAKEKPTVAEQKVDGTA